MTTTVQHIHPLATRIKKIFTLLLLAAWLAPAAGLGPSPAAAAESCPKPSMVSQAGYALSAKFAVDTVLKMEGEIRKIPFIGKPIVDGLFQKLKNLPLKTSKEFGKYLEFTSGKSAITIFNIGTYAGSPRLVVAYSYNGILSTRGKPEWTKSGVWKHIPGIEFKYPVIIYRASFGPGSIATPQVPGNKLKTLPGQLGKVADKAAKITRTLRIPIGALMLSGWEPKGTMKVKMELLHLPNQTVYLMAGAGAESFPPGGTKIGKCNINPIYESYNNFMLVGKDGKERGEEFAYPQKMLPKINAYLKISVPGKWKNPMSIFDRQAYAEDAVLMFTPGGSVASWGVIRNYFKKDYIYAIDLPGILDAEKASKLDLPDIGFGLSVKEFTLADAVNLKLGMMTKFTHLDFLRKLSVLAGATNISQGKWAEHLSWVSGAGYLGHLGRFHHAFALGMIEGGGTQDMVIGVGAWFGTIMLFNVWVLIWPNQKKILGMVEASADEIAKAKNVALLASRTNTLLSIPMIMSMVGYGHGGFFL